MDTPTVFVSYSHKDEAWKDRLLPQLKALEQAGVLDVWEDRKIDAGDKWYPEIRAAMEKAAVSVCLISANYLASDFCTKEEVPFMLKRCEQEGMVLLPVLLSPCVWKAHRWLKDTQMWPRDGKTVEIDFEDKWSVPFAQVAEQIYDRILAGIDLKTPTTRSADKPSGLMEKLLENVPTGGLTDLLAGIIGKQPATSLSFPSLDTLGTLISQGRTPTSVPAPAAPAAPTWSLPEKIDITRLPTTGMDVFGRDKELNLLDEVWEKREVKVISFVAWGGVGKSTLINKWLEAMRADNYRGAERIYAWSFYSQGTNDRAASADLFIDQALRWFGDADPTAGTPWDKGERLAALIRQQPTLLLLDGLEPLQSPYAHERGKLKDPALLTLLEELARDSSGLCVITTREPLADLEGSTGSVSDLSLGVASACINAPLINAQVAHAPRSAFTQINLETLSPAAARAFLRVGGVRGSDEELTTAAEAFGSHALALKLLAEYLRDIPGHSIAEAARIPDLDIPEDKGKHPRRVIAALAQRLGEGAEIEVLRLLGLFNRTADKASLDALRQAPVIAGLTEHISETDEANWLRALQRLRKYKLLDEASHHAPDELEAHPLVREHFSDVLQQYFPKAWRAANDRL